MTHTEVIAADIGLLLISGVCIVIGIWRRPKRLSGRLSLSTVVILSAFLWAISLSMYWTDYTKQGGYDPQKLELLSIHTTPLSQDESNVIYGVAVLISILLAYRLEMYAKSDWPVIRPVHSAVQQSIGSRPRRSHSRKTKTATPRPGSYESEQW